MQTTRWLGAFAFATTIAITGCCGAEEERAVTVWAPDSLTVIGDGVTRRIASVIRLTEPPASPSTFQFVYNTIEGSTSGEGIALSLSGNDPVSDELVIFTLALPVSLRKGDEYSVGATFTVEPGFTSDPRMWGPHDLQQSTQAEVAFTVATYTFPPGVFNTTFVAETSTGTIRVTERERGRVELLVDLSFADANGKTTTVIGRVHASTEKITRPCFS